MVKCSLLKAIRLFYCAEDVFCSLVLEKEKQIPLFSAGKMEFWGRTFMKYSINIQYIRSLNSYVDCASETGNSFAVGVGETLMLNTNKNTAKWIYEKSKTKKLQKIKKSRKI